MKQQINLYTPKTPAARDIWSLRSAIGLILLATVAMGIISWGVDYYAATKLARVEVLRAHEADLPEQIARLEAQRKSLRADPAILEEQDRIRDKITDKNELISLLNRMQPGVANNGFSPFMYGLAEARRDGVWVTEFVLDLANQRVTLDGVSGRADDVPLLMRDLGETQAFRAMRIEKFTLTQQEKVHQFEVLARVNSAGGQHER